MSLVKLFCCSKIAVPPQIRVAKLETDDEEVNDPIRINKKLNSVFQTLFNGNNENLQSETNEILKKIFFPFYILSKNRIVKMKIMNKNLLVLLKALVTKRFLVKMDELKIFEESFGLN